MKKEFHSAYSLSSWALFEKLLESSVLGRLGIRLVAGGLGERQHPVRGLGVALKKVLRVQQWVGFHLELQNPLALTRCVM